MDKLEGFSRNRDPLFDGSNYSFWSIKMRTYLMALGFDIWSVVNNGYTTLTTPHVDTTRKSLSDNNAKSMNAIMCGLRNSKFVKVMRCVSTKEMWDNLHNIYE
jgi:hypothetical protein